MKPEDIKLFSEIVRTIAGQINAKTPDKKHFDDFYQVGWLGVLDALKRYKGGPDRSTLRNYVSRRVRGQITDYQRESDYISRGARQKYNKIKKVREEMAQKESCPSIAKICKEIGLTEEEYNYVTMLENAFGGNIEYDTTTGAELVSKEFKFKDTVALEKALAVLNEEEQRMVHIKYIDGLNNAEIARQEKVGESAICFRFSKIMMKMRGALKIK